MAGDALEIERTSGTPSGWKGKISGRDTFLYVLMFFMFAVIICLIVFNLRFWGEPFDLKQSIAQHNIDMNQQHLDYVKSMNDLVYVISVCFNEARKKECERINISMPDSMFRRLNNGQQP